MPQEHCLSRAKVCRTLAYSRSVLYQPNADWEANDVPAVNVISSIIVTPQPGILELL
jgi:hypothetical protein